MFQNISIIFKASIYSLLVFGVFSCTSPKNEASLSNLLLPKNYECDTTYNISGKDGNKTIFCIKKDKENYLKLNESGDTVEIKRFLNSSVYERVLFKNNKIESKRLATIFNDIDYTIFNTSKNNNFIINVKKEDKRVYFRLNDKAENVAKVDSITIYKTSNFFPFYGYLEELEVDQVIYSRDKWINIPNSIIQGDSIISALLSYKPLNIPKGVDKQSKAQRLFFIDKSIYKWAINNR